MKVKQIFLIIFINFNFIGLFSQTFLNEDFESGAKPDGWTTQTISGSTSWRYQRGGYSSTPEDVLSRNPSYSHSGVYNALFQVENYTNITRLITNQIDLSESRKPELSYWYAMMPWGDDWDKMKVYFRCHTDSSWIQIKEHNDSTSGWVYSNVFLPDSLLTTTCQIAFEGISGWGFGVCLDDVSIVEKGKIPKYLKNNTITHSNTSIIPSGSNNNPILKINIETYGNTGNLYLDTLVIDYIGNESNISSSGVKLFVSQEINYTTKEQLGISQSIASGKIYFNNLNYNLPSGNTYIWITLDIDENATHNNFVDAKISAENIKIHLDTSIIEFDQYVYPVDDKVYYVIDEDTNFVNIYTKIPLTEKSPTGNRQIQESIFYDSFEDTLWTLTGDFEINVPQGYGGTDGGNPDPENSIYGNYILGNDLTNDGDYPNSVDSVYYAESPVFNCYYFKTIKASYYRWLNVESFDDATISFSIDSGKTWNTISDLSGIYDLSWNYSVINLNNTVDRSYGLQFRFNMGPTDGSSRRSGWNIDNFAITGDYILNDVGITNMLTPGDGCGHTNTELVTVTIKNYGPVISKDTIPLAYSFNGGTTYVYDTLFESINAGQEKVFVFSKPVDLSVPGHYNNIIVKTLLSSDEYSSNDQYDTSLYIEPTYSIPYSQSFESGTNFWFADNQGLWEFGTPSGSIIKNAASGTKAWATKLNGYYGSNDSSYIESPCFDFTGIKYPVIDFNINYSTRNDSDGLVILYSIDQGSTWNNVDTLDYKWNWNWYKEDTIIALQSFGFNGNSEGWKHVHQFLPNVIANQSGVKFRFLFESEDNNDSYEGVAIDDIRFFEAPPDVGVTEVISPDSACEFSTKQVITIQIKNYAFDTLEAGIEIPMGFDFNGSLYTIDTLVLPSELIPDATVNFTFSDSVEMHAAGRYYFDIYTLLDNDTDYYIDSVNNDTLSTFISVYGMPDYDLGPTIGMETIDTVLDAGAGYVSYNWEYGDSLTRYYHVTASGTYNVTVQNIHGCVKSDSVKVLHSVEDLGVTAMVSPQSDCEFPNDTVLKITIKNFKGAVYPSGDTIVVGYILNNQPAVIDSIFLEDPLGASASFDYEFANPVDLSEFTDYQFYFFTILDGDLDYSNDTLITTITSWGYPDVEIGPDTIFTSRADTITFDAGDGFATYLWQNGSTNQTFTPPNRTSKEYKVTVTDIHGCGEDTDSVQIIAYDLSVYGINYPVSACVLTNNETVNIRVRNNGHDTIPSGSLISVSYKIDNQTAVNENITLISNLIPTGYRDYSFISHADMSTIKSYNLSAFVSFPQDINHNNDTLKPVISHWGYPAIDLGPDTLYTAQADTVQLIANPDYAYYLWNTGSNNDTLTVPDNSSKWYSVTVTSDHGCSSKDSTYLFTFDVGITNVSSPVSNCELTNSELVRVSIFNYGLTAIPSGTNIPLRYSVNSGTIISEGYTLTTNLNSGASVNYDFVATINMEAVGSYFVEAYTSFLHDVVPDNDDYSKEIHVYGYPVVDIGPDTLFTALPDTLLLVAPAGYSNYHWNTGGTGNTLPVTALNSSWYKVDVESQYGCSSSDSLFIYAYDLGITDILSPVNNCELTGTENITITVSNLSSDTFKTGQEIKLAYRIDSNTPVIETYSLLSDLLPSSSINYTFSMQGDFENIDSYTLRAYSILYQDVDPTNNERVETVTVYGYPDINLGNDTTIRALEYTLDAGGPYSEYLWQDGSTGQTFDVQNSGTYWVSIDDINGCGDSDTINIIMLIPDISVTNLINPKTQCYNSGTVYPVVRLQNTGSDTIKAGETINIGYSINNSFVEEQQFTVNSVLYPSNEADFTFTNSIDVLQYQSHNFKIYSDFARDLISSNDTFLISKTIYPFPTVNLGNDFTLNTKQYLLDAGYNVNYSYLWNDNSTEQTYRVHYDGSIMKTYSVSVTDNRLSGCTSTDAINITFRITDISLDSIIVQSPICQNQFTDANVIIQNIGNTNLQINETFVIGYIAINEVVKEYNSSFNKLLQKGQKDTITIQNIILNHEGEEDVKFYVRLDNDVDPENDTLIKSVSTNPVPKSTMGGDTDTLKAPLPITLTPLQGQSAYTWDNGATSPTLSATSEKWYWVDITGLNGCIARDSVYIISEVFIIPVTGLNEKIYVYPVPATNILNIVSETFLSDDYDYVLYDNLGKIIENGQIYKNQKVHYRLNIEHLPSGIYVIKVFNNKQSYTKTLILNTGK